MDAAAHEARTTPPAFLSEEKKAAIYAAAVRILDEIGMRCDHDEAQVLLTGAGATIDPDGRTRVPAALVERARACAPAAFTVFDREGAPAMDLGGRRAYFGTGSDLMHVYDLESGERRLSRLDDVSRAARLCDALAHIDFVMSSAYAHDVDPHHAYLEQFRAMLLATAKPLVVTAEHAGDLGVMRDVAAEIRGGGGALRERPYLIAYNEPSSPLAHPRESVAKLLLCADAGIPTVYSPAPLAGATAPLTVAGHVAQGTAEALFGLVLHQLRRPGAPFVFGMGPAVLDMATMQSSYNAPEYLQSYACVLEMAKWLDLPNWGYAGTSDAQLVDAQAGAEAAELTLLSLLLGSNLNHDVGYLGFGLTGSLELIVVMDEYLALNRVLLGGVEVNPETLALDAVADVGPGGDFLAHRHTARHLRGAQWRPAILNRRGYERWCDEGASDLREAARGRARRLPAEHPPRPLAPGLATRVDELVDAYRAEET